MNPHSGPRTSADRNQLGALKWLLVHLKAMIDKPNLDSVTVRQVQARQSAEDLLNWLKSLDERFDVSMFRVDGGLWALEARKWYEGLERQYNASCPEDYGTIHRGLCYLFALTFDQFSQELDRVLDAYDTRLKAASHTREQDTPRAN